MYKTIDIADELIIEKVSTSQVSTQTLGLADYLGNPFSSENTDLNISETNVDFKEWMCKLYQWKKPVLVKACYVVTEATLPIMEKIINKALLNTDNYWQKESYIEMINNVKAAIRVTERWLLYQDNHTTNDAAEMCLQLKEIVDMMTLWCYQYGGVGEIKIVYILNAAFNTISAVTWDYKKLATDLLPANDDELVADIIYGPILETLHAIDYARMALDITEVEMKKLIGEALDYQPAKYATSASSI